MKSNNPEVPPEDGYCHFDDLSDELLVIIFKGVDTKSVTSLLKVSKRFLRVTTGNTFKLDPMTLASDDSMSPIGMRKFILMCNSLKHLDLVIISKRDTRPFLDELFESNKMRIKFAKDLFINCPNIRIFEVASLKALMMLRDYSKMLFTKTGECNIREVRVYVSNSIHVRNLMMSINQYSPHLKIFKLLRRNPINGSRDRTDKNPDIYPQLWQSMAPKLTGFSTNVLDRGIISSAIRLLVNVERLVIWYLNSEEMETLCRNLTNIRILILMGCDVSGLKYVSRLPHLEEFQYTFLKPQSDNRMITNPTGLQSDFKRIFQTFGPQLQKLSLSFSVSPEYFNSCFDHLSTFSTGLKEFKVNGAPRIFLGKVCQKIKSLEYLFWSGDILTFDDINKTFICCPHLKRFVVNLQVFVRKHNK